MALMEREAVAEVDTEAAAPTEHLVLSSIKQKLRLESQQDVELKARLIEADGARIENDGRAAFFRLRERWSTFLRLTIAASILFQFTLAFALGFSWVDFTHYHDVLTWIVVTNFGQIVGMGYIIVRHLFPTEAE
jgi:hypothetical protein